MGWKAEVCFLVLSAVRVLTMCSLHRYLVLTEHLGAVLGLGPQGRQARLCPALWSWAAFWNV
jgi:hypothetical protein